MGLFQPTTLLLPIYPEGSRAAIGEAGPASTESAAADKRALLVPFQLFRANPSGATPGLLACCLRQSLPSHVGTALEAVKASLLGPQKQFPSAFPKSGDNAGLARRCSGGRHSFTATENKSLTAISNRNSNDSRKLTTHSESTTSQFLIATKMHVSEEKAKSEEKTNPLKGLKSNCSGPFPLSVLDTTSGNRRGGKGGCSRLGRCPSSRAFGDYTPWMRTKRKARAGETARMEKESIRSRGRARLQPQGLHRGLLSAPRPGRGLVKEVKEEGGGRGGRGGKGGRREEGKADASPTGRDQHDTGCRTTEEQKTRTLSAQTAERMRHPNLP
jgi:hypothetical protein